MVSQKKFTGWKCTLFRSSFETKYLNVSNIPVRGFFAQIRRQVNDSDSLKRTFFHTNTTTNAEFFRNGGNLYHWSDFYTQFSHPDNWTRFFALLPTSFGFAFIIIDYSNPGLGFGLIGSFSVQFRRHFEAKILWQLPILPLQYTCFVWGNRLLLTVQ